jgi:hypothetical protein
MVIGGGGEGGKRNYNKRILKSSNKSKSTWNIIKR